MLETFYHMPFANRIMKIMRAFPMPDMTTGMGFTKKGASMKRSRGYPMPWKGDSVLMYPSGKLMRSNLELLGAASGVQRTLESTGDVQIVLVRTRGLWAVRFQRLRPTAERLISKKPSCMGFGYS